MEKLINELEIGALEFSIDKIDDKWSVNVLYEHHESQYEDIDIVARGYHQDLLTALKQAKKEKDGN